MSFVLYAGTTHALLRRKFDKDSADLPVESLTNRDSAIRQHFASPQVQYIGSTSNCGCKFPHAMFQNGGWPEIDYQDPPEDELDLARAASERKNCRARLRQLVIKLTSRLLPVIGPRSTRTCAQPAAANSGLGPCTRRSVGFRDAKLSADRQAWVSALRPKRSISVCGEPHVA
jgi:hypothetical protein